jgi:hypothetical protein
MSVLLGPTVALVCPGESGELIGRGAALDLGEEEHDLGARLGRQAARERRLEIALRHGVGAEPEIERAELDLHPRQIGVVEQHPLQRPDGRLAASPAPRSGRRRPDWMGP